MMSRRGCNNVLRVVRRRCVLIPRRWREIVLDMLIYMAIGLGTGLLAKALGAPDAGSPLEAWVYVGIGLFVVPPMGSVLGVIVEPFLVRFSRRRIGRAKQRTK